MKSWQLGGLIWRPWQKWLITGVVTKPVVFSPLVGATIAWHERTPELMCL